MFVSMQEESGDHAHTQPLHAAGREADDAHQHCFCHHLQHPVWGKWLLRSGSFTPHRNTYLFISCLRRSWQSRSAPRWFTNLTLSPTPLWKSRTPVSWKSFRLIRRTDTCLFFAILLFFSLNLSCIKPCPSCLSDFKGSGHPAEELLSQYRANGSQETLPHRHDKTLQ